MATVADIARVVKVPLTVDVEGGYSGDAAAVGETVAAVIEAGAVGINIEDGAGDPDLLCAKIERAKEARGVRRGVDLFVNARTDVYLRDLAPPERRDDGDARSGPSVTAPPAPTGSSCRGSRTPPRSGRSPPAPVAAERDGARRPAPGPSVEALGVRRLSSGVDLAEAAFARIASLATGFLGTARPSRCSRKRCPTPRSMRSCPGAYGPPAYSSRPTG